MRIILFFSIILFDRNFIIPITPSFFQLGADPNQGHVFRLARNQFRHFGYDRNIFRTLVAAGLDLRKPFDEESGPLTILQAAQESGNKQWIEDVLEALKAPLSLLSLARKTIIRDCVIVNENEVEPVIQDILEFDLMSV